MVNSMHISNLFFALRLLFLLLPIHLENKVVLSAQALAVCQPVLGVGRWFVGVRTARYQEKHQLCLRRALG